MKKQKNWLQWIDDRILHWSFIFFIVATALVPKVPIQHVEYTYIRIRVDDLLPVLISLVFFIQWIRRKITLNTKLLIPIMLFWAAVLTSFLLAYYVQFTVPVFNLGLLHSLRRVQYMIIFFIASSIVTTDKKFYQYMHIYLGALLFTSLYALGQKFGFLPSIQSMNPAYVDGRLLWLNPEDRVNATFGGHFDLAAYLTFSIPILLGFYFAKGKKWLIATFVLALTALLYTAARSSFVAYIFSIVAFLVFIRKFKFLTFTLILTAVLLLVTGDMTKRFLQTVQVKTVFVNEKTGVENIDQKISVKNLPAGNYKIRLPFKIGGPANVKEEEIRQAARSEVYEEARRTGRVLTGEQIEQEAAQLTQFIKPQRTVLCDISCATRLQVEWPRAILAFKKNPIFGRGPSSITEATDNDLLRWLGELGIVGTSLFIFIIGSVTRTVQKLAKNKKLPDQYIFYGFLFGLIALLINGIYVDVFEASKVAYNFWLVAGIFIGLASIYEKTSNK